MGLRATLQTTNIPPSAPAANMSSDDGSPGLSEAPGIDEERGPDSEGIKAPEVEIEGDKIDLELKRIRDRRINPDNSFMVNTILPRCWKVTCPSNTVGRVCVGSGTTDGAHSRRGRGVEPEPKGTRNNSSYSVRPLSGKRGWDFRPDSAA